MSQSQGTNINTEGQTLVFSGSHLGVWWSEAYAAYEQNEYNMVSIFAALRRDGDALDRIVDGYAPGQNLGPAPVATPPAFNPFVTNYYDHGIQACSPWASCDPWTPPMQATPEPSTGALFALVFVLSLALWLAQKARDAVRR